MDAPVDGPAMTVDQTTRALHPKCHSEMVYVTAYPNATSNAVKQPSSAAAATDQKLHAGDGHGSRLRRCLCSQRDRIHRNWSDLGSFAMREWLLVVFPTINKDGFFA